MRTLRISTYIAATVSLIGAVAARPAHAHFLWAELHPDAQAILQLRFAEAAGEKTVPDLLEKIKPARVWTPGNTSLTLTAADGALETTLPPGVRTACAEQVWGVLDRTAQGRGIFLLHYYAKAAVDLAAASEPAGLSVEASVKREASKFIVTVSHDGKPVSGSEVIVTRPGNENLLALKTDISGKTQFTVGQAGLCGLRALVEEKQEGEYEGKAYKLVRHYTTLTFPVNAGTSAPSPPSKADPDAWGLLKLAHDSRYIVPNDFPGVEADVVFEDGNGAHSGKLTYTKSGYVQLQIEDTTDEAKSWLRGQLSNSFGHRRGGDFAKGDGRHPITFGAKGEETLLGRQVQLNDGLDSFYRVRDKVVTEVTRTMGDTRFTITVLEARWIPSGKYLPRHFVVSYFDVKTGALRRAESYSDVYAPVGGVWLPQSRCVTVAESGRITARRFVLKNARLLPADTASAR